MLTGTYFDGQSTRCQEIRLAASDGKLRLSSEQFSAQFKPGQFEISEAMGSAARIIRLPEGRMIEVAQGAALDALLTALDHRDSFAARMQAHWAWALIALLLVASLFYGGYRWGLPLAAEQIAPKLPASLIARISEHTLAMLDAQWLQPSKLSAKRKAALEQSFAQLRTGSDGVPDARLHFRSAPKAGPNAFALPDGQVVLFDELVALTDDDTEILAVLSHELGHVHNQHGARLAIESSVIGVVAATWLGDISSMAALFSTLALTSNYSREMEEEADDYAMARLRAMNISPLKLASMFEKTEAAESSENKKAAPSTGLFSGHPETAERIRRIRGMQQN